MSKTNSKSQRSIKKGFRNLSLHPPNDAEPSTTSSPREPIPHIAATSSPLASKHTKSSRSLSTAPMPYLKPNGVTQPPPTKKGAVHDAWLGLKAFARVIGKGGASFAPLKEAIGGVVEVVDTFELVAQNRDDYQNLRIELNGLFHDLAGYFGSSTPPAMTSSIINLAQGIERELKIIRWKQHQSRMRGYVGGGADADQILEHYRSIQALLQRLTLNANVHIWRAVDEQATENRLSKLPNSPAARYRSAKSSTVLRGECTPNTRVKVLQDLDQWASDSRSQRVYWLNGMAGTGKTTIAYSFCRKLESLDQLAASFFCSRQLQGCHDVDQIVPTISYQLSRFSLPFRMAISEALEKDSEIHNQLLLDQFRQLIVEPSTKCKSALPTNLIVVIDALDECEGGRGAEFTKALLLYAWDLPVKFFVASRPDTRILDLMRGREGNRISMELRLHDLDRSIVKEDIRTYLIARIPSHIQLSEAHLDTLVERSGVLFIYAATVVRYIESESSGWAKKRLKEVLASAPDGSASNSDKDINTLYNTILKAAFESPSRTESERAEMKQILNTVACAQEPLSISTMAGLLGLDCDAVRAALGPLLSVLHVSDTTEIVATLHESFPDYLLNKIRSGALYCNSKKHNGRLTRMCFNQISIPNPAINICRLESSYVLDADVPYLATRVEKAISAELRYACRYWGVHMMLAKDSKTLARMLLRFLEERFLLWLEVVNLCEDIYDGVRMLYRMQKWASNAGRLNEHTKQLLRDGWMFAASFSSSPARHSTPHIYVSALTFWPDHSPMARLYQQNGPRLIAGTSTAMKLRSVVPLSVQITEGSVHSLSYSPDGAYIISGSSNFIRIWDAHTGQPVGQSLQGHTKTVRSVAYSSDGAYIVSGSDDSTIRIWDVHTRQQVGEPLQGHTSSVHSVAYSPDGAYIVSGSDDRSMRIWDTHTRQQVGKPFPGSRPQVTFVVYSPNGAYIVYGTYNGTICIRNAHTCEYVGELDGHASGASSVAYSPDGAYMVSGSSDHTVRVWDACTHEQVGQPLEGHTGRVNSVAYSPDGAYITSSSNDNTIRIWDARTLQQVGQPLQGHTDHVKSVAYSPDGAYIVSGSDDSTIRIWDARARQKTGLTLQGHTGFISSVAYSPSGACIISGSDDNTIRIWDAQTHQQVGQPLRGHLSTVISVAYSSDGAYIVSGSDDSTIRIWDSRTGQRVGQTLRGHTDSVNSVAYSPDGAHIVSGSYYHTILIWDSHTRQRVGQPPLGQPLLGHTSHVTSLAYSLNGAYIVSGFQDHTIRIWDTHTRRQVGQPLEGHTGRVNSVAYSPDGAYIVSGSNDNTIRIWDAHTRQQVGEPLQGHTNTVLSVVYSPDGAYIVSGSHDKTIRIWDTHTRQQIGPTLRGHTGSVGSVACSPDGAYITSGSQDETVRIWGTQSFIPTSVVRKPHNNSRMAHPSHFNHEANFIPRRLGCNLGCLIDCPHIPWTLDEDGWIVFDNYKLIWVPLDLRATLASPQNAAVIHRRGCLYLDLDRNKLGDRWCESFRPGRSTRP